MTKYKKHFLKAFLVFALVFVPFATVTAADILIENVVIERDGKEVKRPIPLADFVEMVMEKVALLEDKIRALGGVPVNQITIDSILSPGDSGPEVKDLQTLLNTTDALRVATDGPGSAGFETEYFGPLTKDAVMRFQQANDLTSSGIVDDETRDVLNNLFVR